MNTLLKEQPNNNFLQTKLSSIPSLARERERVKKGKLKLIEHTPLKKRNLLFSAPRSSPRPGDSAPKKDVPPPGLSVILRSYVPTFQTPRTLSWENSEKGNSEVRMGGRGGPWIFITFLNDFGERAFLRSLCFGCNRATRGLSRGTAWGLLETWILFFWEGGKKWWGEKK